MLRQAVLWRKLSTIFWVLCSGGVVSYYERLPFEWNFRWFFLDKWICTFFPLRTRNRLNRIIWSELSDASEPSTRNMASQLPLVLDVLSDDLEIVFFFLEKATISSFKLLQHPHFVRETSNPHPQFFPRCSSGGSTLECERKTQLQTTKRNSFSPAGLHLCSKTSANTNDEQRHSL